MLNAAPPYVIFLVQTKLVTKNEFCCLGLNRTSKITNITLFFCCQLWSVICVTKAVHSKEWLWNHDYMGLLGRYEFCIWFSLDVWSNLFFNPYCAMAAHSWKLRTAVLLRNEMFQSLDMCQKTCLSVFSFYWRFKCLFIPIKVTHKCCV